MVGAPSALQRTESDPLHLLIVSNTGALPFVQGADRDWINLLNASGPDHLRVTWVGLEASEGLRAEIDERVLLRTLDIKHPCFYQLTPGNIDLARSPWRWLKIAAGASSGLSRSFFELQRALRGAAIDLVVTNTSVVLLGALFALLTHRPHVWTIKEYLDPRVPACRRFAEMISRLSAAVIVPSKVIAEAFRSPVHVLPDGSDVQRITSNVKSNRMELLRSLGLPLELPLVVQIGAICERKGQHVTAKAFVKSAHQGGPPPFSLLFLGAGSPHDLERVHRVLSEAPASWRDVVRFSTFRFQDLSPVAAADIVVHPSLFNDAFPNAVREAMILGRPVIAASIGGMPDMIIDGETGMLVPSGEADALSGALAHLIQQPERRRHLGERAAVSAGRDFDSHYRKLAYLRLLNDVCQISPRRAQPAIRP